MSSTSRMTGVAISVAMFVASLIGGGVAQADPAAPSAPSLAVGSAPAPGNGGRAPIGDGLANTGVVADMVPLAPLNANQQAVFDRKMAVHDFIARGGNPRTATQIMNDGTALPAALPRLPIRRAITSGNAVYTNLATVGLYREGEGNGWKWYTCGPSATRNMVHAYNGTNYAEDTIAGWEATTSSGTSTDNITKAMNAHIGGSVWYTKVPVSSSDYLTYVKGDTNLNQSITQNQATQWLPFWNGHAAGHFNNAYGYNTGTSPNSVYVAEEWDPTVNGAGGSYGNPYGYHLVDLNSAYNATHNSLSRALVY